MVPDLVFDYTDDLISSKSDVMCCVRYNSTVSGESSGAEKALCWLSSGKVGEVLKPLLLSLSGGGTPETAVANVDGEPPMISSSFPKSRT